MESLFSERVSQLRAIAEEAVIERVAPEAERVDREGVWPEASLRALAARGLLGLQVPQRLGGHGQGMVALVALTETIARACPSTALCFGMHCVGSAVMAAKATPEQEERYLRPIVRGEHITSLSLSEAGSGSQFYFPETTLGRQGDEFVVDGGKQFVTSGGQADSYVLSVAGTDSAGAGEFSCVVVDKGTPGLKWQEPWNGFGMRGNSSLGLKLKEVRLPIGNLLGNPGDELWYVFEVIAPYFLIAMSGTYLGIASAAVDIAMQHLRNRRHSHSGERLGEVAILQHRLGEIWTEVEKTRALVYHAARLGDAADARALPAILACKAAVAEAAVLATNESMTLCGGIAYRDNAHLARLLRDARAAHVMSPTTDILKQWTGRALLGLPLL